MHKKHEYRDICCQMLGRSCLHYRGYNLFRTELLRRVRQRCRSALLISTSFRESVLCPYTTAYLLREVLSIDEDLTCAFSATRFVGSLWAFGCL